MPKYQIPIAYETSPKQARSRAPWALSIFVVLACLAPLVVEGASICYSQWCEVLGISTHVSTPISDAIRAALVNTHESLVDRLSPPFQRILRSPGIVLPVSGVFIAIAIALLRR